MAKIFANISPKSLCVFFDQWMGSLSEETINSFVSINCSIGRCVKINVGATVMHDVIIGDYVTVAPRAVILGRAKIGKNVFIGANATILPDVEIGDNSIIGAGAVVTKNIPGGVTARGVPAVYNKK